jgi:hypothetical protein
MKHHATPRERSRCALALAAFVIAVTGVSCSGGSSSPTEPSATASVNGTWSGSASDSTGPGTMTWQLTQSGSSFSGTMTMSDTSTNTTGRGTVSGTLSGSTCQFSVSVPVGGFDNPYAACSASVSGNGTVSSTVISGNYTGSSTCAGTIGSGQVNLNKQ